MPSMLKVVLLQVWWLLMLGVAILFTSITSLMTWCLSWLGNLFGKLRTLSGEKLVALGKNVDSSGPETGTDSKNSPTSK